VALRYELQETFIVPNGKTPRDGSGKGLGGNDLLPLDGKKKSL
jgi:hypothetical protein